MRRIFIAVILINRRASCSMCVEFVTVASCIICSPLSPSPLATVSFGVCRGLEDLTYSKHFVPVFTNVAIIINVISHIVRTISITVAFYLLLFVIVVVVFALFV